MHQLRSLTLISSSPWISVCSVFCIHHESSSHSHVFFFSYLQKMYHCYYLKTYWFLSIKSCVLHKKEPEIHDILSISIIKISGLCLLWSEWDIPQNAGIGNCAETEGKSIFGVCQELFSSLLGITSAIPVSYKVVKSIPSLFDVAFSQKFWEYALYYTFE